MLSNWQPDVWLPSCSLQVSREELTNRPTMNELLIWKTERYYSLNHTLKPSFQYLSQFLIWRLFFSIFFKFHPKKNFSVTTNLFYFVLNKSYIPALTSWCLWQPFNAMGPRWRFSDYSVEYNGFPTKTVFSMDANTNYCLFSSPFFNSPTFNINVSINKSQITQKRQSQSLRPCW